ncbi:hypothetical protein [Halocatena halophila]|uniref:hypothetical protein n=1 Tax=Halocatena halophila TaxID=2814576 RepID=UPI002ED01D8C
MAIDRLGGLVARERRSNEPALLGAASGREYDYRRFCTTAWKVGNLLRHYGVRAGDQVGLLEPDAPESIFTLLGASLLGASVSVNGVDRTKAIVGPTDAVSALDSSTRRIGYGSVPAQPTVAHFEGEVWSENPTAPPDSVEPTATVLETATEQYTHSALLTQARALCEGHEIEPDTTVVLRESLSNPATIVGGVIAPLLSCATIAFPAQDRVGDVAIGANGAPEPRHIPLSAVHF